MKKTKFAVLFTALVSMLGLSSCLGEPDPYTTADGIFRAEGVVGYYKFKTAYGITVTPTNQNMITSDLGDFAYIYYKYDNRTVTQGTSNIDAELQQPPVPIKTVGYTLSEMKGNAPMVSYQNEKEINMTPYLYDKNNLFLSLSYNVRYNKNDESKNDLNSHSFYLFEDNDKEGYDENYLVLRLSHVYNPGVSIENEAVKTINDLQCVDLSPFMSSGKTYKQIIIKYQVEDNSSSSSEEETVKLKDASEPFKLDYEMFLSYFPKE